MIEIAFPFLLDGKFKDAGLLASALSIIRVRVGINAKVAALLEKTCIRTRITSTSFHRRIIVVMREKSNFIFPTSTPEHRSYFLSRRRYMYILLMRILYKYIRVRGMSREERATCAAKSSLRKVYVSQL